MTNFQPGNDWQRGPQGANSAPYGYPQQVVGGYQPSPPRGLSIASMVLGLVSILAGFTFFIPIVGLILGLIGIRKEPTGRGMAITGLVLNGLFVVGWTLFVVFLVIVGVGAAGTATYSG